MPMPSLLNKYNEMELWAVALLHSADNRSYNHLKALRHLRFYTP